LRSTIVSPISTPLRSTSRALCSVAWATVEPATLTGSSIANGVTRPVRPDVHVDVEQLGGDLLGRVFERDRPARRPAGRAEPALDRHRVDLDHHAVDLVLDVVPVLAVVAMYSRTPARPSTSFHRSLVGSPTLQRLVRVRLRVGREADPGADAVHHHAQPADAVIRGSFCRRLPAAALRGLANGALPCSTSDALRSAKAETGK
jgi:hypothetical protein